MSKYFVFGGIMWVFASIIIGLMIVLTPSQQLSVGNNQVQSTGGVKEQGALKDEPSKSAEVKAHIDGTPKEGGESVQARVKID